MRIRWTWRWTGCFVVALALCLCSITLIFLSLGGEGAALTSAGQREKSLSRDVSLPLSVRTAEPVSDPVTVPRGIAPQRAVVLVAQRAVVVFLARPRRSFHGDHWFHFGEHYLSQRDMLSAKIAQYMKNSNNNSNNNSKKTSGYNDHDVDHDNNYNNNNRNVNKTNNSVRYHSPIDNFNGSRTNSIANDVSDAGVHVYLVTHEAKIAEMATPMTLFLAVLSLYTPGLTSVSLVRTAAPLDALLRERENVQCAANEEAVCASFSFSLRERARHESVLLSFSMQRPVETRFERTMFAGTETGKEAERVRAPLVAITGREPVPSTRWFASAESAQRLREAVKETCAGSESLLERVTERDRGVRVVHTQTNAQTQGHHSASRPLRLLVYQRDEKRKLLGVERLWSEPSSASSVSASVGGGSVWGRLDAAVEVVIVDHDEQRNPCLVAALFDSADILLTSHGFQLIGLFFLRPGTHLLEVFPHKYFKPSYFPLADVFGVRHRWLQSSQSPSVLLSVLSLQTCMEDQLCRSFARTQDISLTADELNAIRSVILYISLGVL